MKLNQLVLLGATSLIITTVPVLGQAAQITASRNLSHTSSASNHNILVAQGKSMAVASGKFLAGEKPTTGSARIVTENGHRYLELDGAFSTSDQGPDLHVLLDTTGKPPQAYKNQGSFVNVGRLQKYNGTQRYPIPDAVNVANFKSVVIWCRMANATFGYAPLQASSGVSAR